MSFLHEILKKCILLGQDIQKSAGIRASDASAYTTSMGVSETDSTVDNDLYR